MADIQELERLVRAFCDERDWTQFHTPKELAIGISTEAAELLQIFRFQSEEQMKALLAGEDTRAKVGEELADVLFFLLRFSGMYGFDLSEELEHKIEKNALRYPVEQARGSNKKAGK